MHVSTVYWACWTSIVLAASSLSCECGYTVNATNISAPFALFTDFLESDFLHLYNLPESVDVPASEAVGWAVEVYNLSATDARGPYGKSAELNNAVLNPLPNRKDWVGEGKLGGPPGLQVWVRGQDDLAGEPGDEMVRVGEINSLRRDMRYGSFRVGMRMSDTAGTCAAFFWYRNNTQEIDMEYLSRQANSSNNATAPINLVIQSPQSADANYNAAGTSTFRVIPLPFMPDTGYHEYRFDWLPERIVFYADGLPLTEFENDFDGDAPDAPGTLMLNHWSNGNGGWSGGPPAQDAVLTVSYIKAYFNSSNSTRESQWSNACADNWMERTCEIPEFPANGINPMSGNVTGDGPESFFMYQGDAAHVNQTMYLAAIGGSQNSAVLVPPVAWSLWACAVVWWLDFAVL